MFKPMSYENIFPKYFVGFDDLLNAASKIHEETKGSAYPSYPPYNIKKINEDIFLIEIACAGFTDSDLDITIIDNKLTVKGTGKQEEGTFVYKGIANRDFTREFTLAENVEVQSAVMNNGILTITLYRILPESKKPRKITIGSTSTKKSFLQE